MAVAVGLWSRTRSASAWHQLKKPSTMVLDSARLAASRASGGAVATARSTRNSPPMYASAWRARSGSVSSGDAGEETRPDDHHERGSRCSEVIDITRILRVVGRVQRRRVPAETDRRFHSLPEGHGETWWFGDANYSTAGSAEAQDLARIHEMVHSFLRPRLKYLRQFRARLNASAYTRSAILRYLEEGLAETIAQLNVRGVSGLITGIRFPLRNGYMTIQQLIREGAELGNIMVGSQRFSVQFVPGPSQVPGNQGGSP